MRKLLSLGTLPLLLKKHIPVKKSAISRDQLCDGPQPAKKQCLIDSSTAGKRNLFPSSNGIAAEELLCLHIWRGTNRSRGGERENEEKNRRQVVIRVHKWLIKPWFLLVTVVKQF